ncbi:MAG: FlgD immunoglobulin-like domain containing protein [Candidatus Krumholzibacteria bacterium]|nr:FlgD immunoglobulin-like domain containing protein [Candidatus Krumholzibacteria bacterium]
MNISNTNIFKIMAVLVLGLCPALWDTPANATTITIVNEDSAGEGFNDPTVAVPVGGNPGVTVGQQRLNAFSFAASVWEGILNSDVEIRIGAKFDPLSCTATGGVLGAAGPGSLHRDYAGATLASTWYVDAEADMHSGLDRRPGEKDITATFNSMLGTTGCLENSSWYYGFDENEGAGAINLVVVLLHEFAHGLGFLSLVNETDGTTFNGFMDAYSRFLFDNTTGLRWDQMSNAQRAASAINTSNLVWTGPSVTGAVPSVLCPPTVVEVTAPAAIAGLYESPLSTFGPSCGATFSGEVVLVNDGSGTTSDGCSAIGQNLTGKIALIDRGVCAFVTKVTNAQNAGAVGVIVVNNVAGDAFAMSGDGPGVTIASVMISLADGNTIKAQLGAGVTATIRPDVTRLAGADANNRVQIYNPNPLEPGSSISHWSTGAFPNLLMEPAINGDLPVGVDMTLHAFEDIGWQFQFVAVTRLPALAADRLEQGVLLSWQIHPDLLDHDLYVHREQETTARVQVSAGPLPWGSMSFLDATAPDGPVDYWLELVDDAGLKTWQGPLHVDGNGVLSNFSFAPGFPNPFRTETQLSYTLPATGTVRLAVHDLRGRLVRELVNGTENIGSHTVFWDGRDGAGARVAAGVYYARVVHDGIARSQKVVVMK